MKGRARAYDCGGHEGGARIAIDDTGGRTVPGTTTTTAPPTSGQRRRRRRRVAATETRPSQAGRPAVDRSPEVVDPGGKVVELRRLSPDEVAELERELDQQHMGHTGGDTDALPLVALIAFVIGSAMIVVGTRRHSAVSAGSPPPNSSPPNSKR
jgi:hypothetical protein